MKSKNCYFELVIKLAKPDAVALCRDMANVLVLGHRPVTNDKRKVAYSYLELIVGVFDDTDIPKFLGVCSSASIMSTRIRGVLDVSWCYTLSLLSSYNKRDIIALYEHASPEEGEVDDQ